MLTKFFNVYATNEEATDLLYREFHEHYMWNRISKRWFQRMKGKVVAEIYGANSIECERYYL